MKKSNSPLYSPLKRASEDTASFSNNNSLIGEENLVSRLPVLNGYTNTVDKIGSQYTNQNSLDDTSPRKDTKSSLKTSKFAGEIQSPGLKHALNNDKNEKKTKMSIFQSEKFRSGSNNDKTKEEEEKRF